MNLNFNPHSGINTSININKLSPEWIIVIGSLLVAYGIYRYYQKDQAKDLNKNN